MRWVVEIEAGFTVVFCGLGKKTRCAEVQANG